MKKIITNFVRTKELGFDRIILKSTREATDFKGFMKQPQLCLGFFIALLLALPAFAQVNKFAIDKVVIDAGHGGHDSGCRGKFSNEKDVALSVSLKLGKLIEENLPEVKVIYTRKTDVFVTLNDRAEIANNNKADLFICIHCNAGSKVASGTEVFVMGLHKTEDNLKLAERENSSILMEADQSKYEGFNPNSPEGYIALSLYQNAYMDQSINLASKVEQNLTSKGRDDRGVKQAGFWVLYRTTMPSILIETGFLTNPTEEQYLNSEQGQNEIAAALFKAFKDYKAENDAKIKQKSKEKAELTPEKKNKDTAENKKTANDKEGITQAKENKTTIAKDTLAMGSNADTASAKNIFFSVQVATTSKNNPADTKKGNFRNLSEVHTEELQDGSIKYLTGKTFTFEEALQLLSETKDKGFPSAFLVAYQGIERIPVKKAQELIKNNTVN